MGRVDFVSHSALTALAVGTFEFFAVCLYLSDWPSEYAAPYLLVVGPAPVAAAISACLCVRDPQFHQRPHHSQTFQVCFLAYALYVPLFAPGVFLVSDLGGAGVLWGAALVFVFSIVPVFVIEYMIIGTARSRRFGVWRED